MGGFGVGVGFTAAVGGSKGLAAGVSGVEVAALGGSAALGRLAGAGLAAVDGATDFSVTLNPPPENNALLPPPATAAGGGLNGSAGGAFVAGLVGGGGLAAARRAVGAAATGNFGGA